MQPAKLSISELFEQREQYLVPLFQRGYVWTLTDQIHPLWEDIADRISALAEHREAARKVGADKLRPLRKHFLGAIIVSSQNNKDTETVPTREVIDGQQRITTLQIMLLAVRDVLRSLNKEDMDEELNKEVINLEEDLAVLTLNKGKYRIKTDPLKVFPTNAGRDVMLSIAAAGSSDEVCKRFPVAARGTDGPERPGMAQAYLFFHAMVQGLISGIAHDDDANEANGRQDQTFADFIISAIDKRNKIGLPYEVKKTPDVAKARLLVDALQSCFQIMRLQLDSDDDPQIIFETLNARGAPLTPSDLIRNFLFLRASRAGDDVDALYDDYWRAFDERPDDLSKPSGAKFWRIETRQGRLKSTRLDAFFYLMTGMRKKSDVKLGHVFDEFKQWWEGSDIELKPELKRISELSRHFEKIVAPGHATALERFSRRMQLLDTTTHIPLLLYLLEHRAPDDADFLSTLVHIESYVVRRFVVGLTTQGYNRIFMSRLLGELASEGRTDSASIEQKLRALEGDSQCWPDDKKFKEAWVYKQLYKGSNTRRVQAVLEGLELQLSPGHHEYRLDPKQLSVEHVLPQKWQPADYPLKDELDATKAARSRLIHSIGNLTLVTPAFNTKLSNEAFSAKRPALARESALALNSYFQEFQDSDPWSETQIIARAEFLYPYAKNAWPCSAK